jgi:hypothetical protein
MTDHHDLPRERLARLETKVEHLTKEMAETHAKVVEMHNLLLQAKGARWFFIGAAALAGFLASYAPKVSSMLGMMPK